jgi:hypothetical protein
VKVWKTEWHGPSKHAMEYKRLLAEYCGVFCEIKKSEPGIGAYLDVFLPNSTSFDELQDSRAICQENAFEE